MSVIPFTSSSTTRPDPIPFDQEHLDRLYWSDPADVKVAEIARTFGLPPSRVSVLATPRATGLTCLLCGGGAVIRSRSRASAEWIDCGECGTACRQRTPRWMEYTRPESNDPSGLRSVGVSAALIRRARRSSPRDVGFDAQEAVDALASIERPLEPGELVTVIEPADGIDEIRTALGHRRPDMLGVANLRTLGDTQTEALQNLFALTGDGWRVVSGRDIDVSRSVRFRDMHAVSLGERVVETDRRPGEPYDPYDLEFADRVINATTEPRSRTRW